MCVALLAGLGLGACGDDDDGTAAQPTDTAADENPPNSVADEENGTGTGSGDAVCGAYVSIVQEMSNSEQPDLAAVERLVEELEAGAPAELADQVVVVIDGVREGIGGDTSFLEDPAFVLAAEELDGYAFEHCDLAATLQVTAVDFGYEGVPETIPAGTVGIRMENESSEEPHEMVLLRRNDGVSETFDELLELPEEDAMTKVTAVGHVFAPPKGGGATYVDLEAGDYLAICFIPQGAGAEGEEPMGPPHFVLGMQQPFSVS